ncbi:MAG TPA: hypothetical protein VE954_42070 [Oligoflexus sp.]|uniref:hypothetical protein n=1 Tax=Oligoflexus sp. TaxID=1971216 RepID=UPI002D5112E6|nr:hypothetical protein [Oligoflexus sp.]HYX39727.1 hypothetical protein [Oligoflexus sp.]
MRHWRKLGTLVSLLGFITASPAQGKEASDTMEFQIRDPATREVFFQGFEKVHDTGASTRKETFFFDKARKEVLMEDAVYNRETLRMETYVSRSSVTGEETVLKTEGKSLKISYRAEGDAPFKETTLSWNADTFHGKTFDDLIVRNWDNLLQGKMLKFDLVLPFRLESRGFQIFRTKRTNLDGQDVEVFALQPQNFLLRALVPKMEFFYAPGTRPQLKMFSGPSVIPIQGETNRTVEIIYGLPGARS